MKKVIYWIVAILWLNILAFNIIPWTCHAAFWDDSAWLIKKINVIGTNKWPSSSLLDTVRNTINWLLWILATVALCICLYAWFKILTSWGDSKSYEAWWTILKNAAIWLAIIWLSWIIVSAVFWFVDLQWWRSTNLQWQDKVIEVQIP